MPDPNPSEFPKTVTPWECQNKRCKKVFPHITVVRIGGKVNRVMVDGCIFEGHIQFQCVHCGGRNYYSQNEKEIQEQNEMLVKILGDIYGQKVVGQNESAIIATDKSTG